MTRREIAILSCKILAIWAFTQAALFGPGVLLMVIIAVSGAFTASGFHWEDLSAAAVTGVPALGAIVIGIILWTCSSRLAGRMVGNDSTPVTRPDITQESILAVALSAIGVWTLIPVLRDLAGNFIRIARGERMFIDYWHSSTWQSNFWSSIIGLVFSIWLIFGSRGVARIVLKLRRPEVEAVGSSEAR